MFLSLFLFLTFSGTLIESAGIIRTEIKASDTNSSIGLPVDQKYVHVAYFNPDKTLTTETLLLIFVGFESDTKQSDLFVQTILTDIKPKHRHAIALVYQNSVDINQFCLLLSEDCYSDFIKNQINNGSNSIINRLISLLKYLNIFDPTPNWIQFLNQPNADVINFTAISVVGHKQGAGVAVMMSRLFRVERVIMLAGVSDWNPEYAHPPSWLYGVGATQQDRLLGLLHVNSVTCSATHSNWEMALRMAYSGQATNIDSNGDGLSAKLPFKHTDQLCMKYTQPPNADDEDDSLFEKDAVKTDSSGLVISALSDAWIYLASRKFCVDCSDLCMSSGQCTATIPPNPIDECLCVSSDLKPSVIIIIVVISASVGATCLFIACKYRTIIKIAQREKRKKGYQQFNNPDEKKGIPSDDEDEKGERLYKIEEEKQ